jgi:photosystem II stability/assembly factor-like uncharacterized protein
MRRIIYYVTVAAFLFGITSVTAQKKWQRIKPSSPNPLPGISFAKGTSQELWRLQARLNDPLDLADVDAVSREVAWTCSGDMVYRTTDAGQTWVPTATVTTTEWFSVIDALNADTAFVGGCGPECFGGDANIYRTTDGGQTWTAVYTATGPISYWNGFHFFDAKNGIALSDPPEGNAMLIVKTTDGGATWTPIANPPTVTENEYGNFKTLSFHDNLNGWFATIGFDGGMGGRVFRTIDGGETWTGYNSGNTDAAWAVQFISPIIGIRTWTSPPFLTRSTDGGQTWTAVSNLPVANIRFMQAATGVNTPGQNQLWVYGEAGTGAPSFTPFVLTSIDAGETWSEQSIANISGSTVVDMSAVSFGTGSDSVQA